MEYFFDLGEAPYYQFLYLKRSKLHWDESEIHGSILLSPSVAKKLFFVTMELSKPEMVLAVVFMWFFIVTTNSKNTNPIVLFLSFESDLRSFSWRFVSAKSKYFLILSRGKIKIKFVKWIASTINFRSSFS